MNRAMTRVAAAAFVALGVIAVWLTLQQTLAGSAYRDDPRNARSIPGADETDRGRIVTTDGVVVAEDVDGVRTYAAGATYLHLVGFSAEGTSAAIESTRASALNTLDDGSLSAWLVDLFGGSVEPPDVRLTAVDRVQRVAAAELTGHTGAIVALDPATGAVLAYASSPAIDPNDLVAGDLSIDEFVEQSAALDRVAFRLLPSGSVFKVLVAAAALEEGFSPDSILEDASEYLAPGAGQPITNVTGATCTGSNEITLQTALATSCNTVFASLAVDLGGVVINDIAERAGFNSVLSFELGAAISSVPDGEALDNDIAALAQTGLGERDVRVTPLQMAVITAAIGNDGELMQPYIVDRIVSRDGTALDTTTPDSLGRLVDPAIAEQLITMMREVVADGTGRAGAAAGVAVAGKTGTAEGAGGPHSWFIALAPADDPTIAVAVVIEGEGTGGTTAAPMAARVIEAWVNAP